MNNPNTPEWVKHAVFYQIFPDRFASSQQVIKPGNLEVWETPPTVYGFKGGDLMGVVEKLDYLSDLGINALYLNPIFQSACSHRYHTHDYYQVDPLLGGNQVFNVLLTQAHQRGIRIILDGVFNHASRGFFQFNHILETGGSSPYIDWFTVYGFPLNAYGPGKPNYKCWYDLAALPEFNIVNPQVRKFIFDIAQYWINQGIDGWRLDVPFCIDDDQFWQEFRHIVKQANPEAYIVGEVPWEAQRWLMGDQFDAVMNYQFTQACLGFFGGNQINRKLEEGMMGLPGTRILDAAGFAQRIEALLALYPHQNVLAQMNLLDSHDMPRFISLVNEDLDALKLAVVFQMTYPGAPCVYYGDEIGIKNGPSKIPEDCRYSFQWDENQWNKELLAHYQRCIQIRQAYPALRTGTFTMRKAEDNVIAYERQLGDQRILVIINNNQNVQKIEINNIIPSFTLIKGLLGHKEAIFSDGVLNLSLSGRTAEVLPLG